MPEKSDRFQRWQSILRDQMSFTNNMLMAFAFTSLGFQLTLLNEVKFSVTGYQKFFFTGGLLLMLASLAIGVVLALNRLADFRTTLKKIKAQNSPENEELIAELRQQSEIYGKQTWCLIKIQAVTFLIGISFLAIAYLWVFCYKLF